MAKSQDERNYNADNTAPIMGLVSVTPADGADLIPRLTRCLWVGGAGNVAVITADGDTVTIVGVPAGTLLPIMVSRVLSTNTTATNILAGY